MIICLSVATVLLTLTSVLVMAEEFQQLPESLQKLSTKLVDNRTSRTVLICGVIILMAFASSLSLVINTSSISSSSSRMNTTKIISPLLVSLALKTNKNRSEINNTFNEDLPVTLYHHGKRVNGSFEFVAYNCTQNCVKNIVNTELRNIHTKRPMETKSRQLFRKNENISATGVITLTYDDCPHPEYIVFTWVLCMIALATALKLYYLIKLFLAIVMVVIYTILILLGYDYVFTGDYINTDE